MQRRYVFAALGIPLALAFYVEGMLMGLRLGLGLEYFIFFLLLFPVLGYAWGRQRDLTLPAGLPARYVYPVLGFALAPVMGLAAGLIGVMFGRVVGGPILTIGAPIIFFLFWWVAMLIFPIIGYVWGRRKDQAGRMKADKP